MITADDQQELIAWAEAKIGVQFKPDAKAIGRVEGERILGVVVYDNFSSCDCFMHIASDGSGHWLSREFLFEAFRYPFIDCDLPRVTGPVPAKNKAALRFDQRLGFKYEGLQRKAIPGDDLIILGMLRSECIFIPKENRHD